MNFITEIRDPVHGYIRITDLEKDLIDNVYLQRLRYIKQLAGAYLVYPGATHSRFEHVIGCMHIAGKIGERLSRLGIIDQDTITELRVAALLHDVGHGPFSHLFDEVLSDYGLTHEDISRELVKRTNIADILSSYGLSVNKISELATGQYHTKKSFLNEVISGSLSADIMDYLLRDSYFTGVEYGKVDIQRIIDSLYVVSNKLAIDRAAIYAFEALLIARYEMFKAVYFHRAVRAAQLMLIRAMKIADRELHLTERWKSNSFIDFTDENVLFELITLKKKDSNVLNLVRSFKERKLLKCVYEVFSQIGPSTKLNWTNPEFKRDLETKVARISDVESDYIYVDTPMAPSIPYSPERKIRESIIIVNTNEKSHEEVPLGQIPLIGAITGYVNILRIYTTEKFRHRVETALREKRIKI